MKNMNEIRRNIRAVQETRQITNAMYLLSTSRIKKAMLEIGHNKSYMKTIRATVKDILIKSPDVHHRYIDEHKHKRAAFLVIASDKGLCGSYNIGVVNCAMKEMKLHENPYVTTIGIMATQILSNYGIKPDHEWLGASQKPTLYFARQIADHFIDLYKTNQIDEVYVVYSYYHTQMYQKPRCVRLLPLSVEDFNDVNLEYEYDKDIIYEPSIKEVFDTMVPQYVIGFIYGCMHQAAASEHSARMNAMQNATNNADEMIKKLNLEFNTARQLAITSEITEIAAATEVIDK